MIKVERVKKIVLWTGFGIISCLSLGVHSDENIGKYSFEIILEQQAKNPRGLAVAPDGSLWLADGDNIIHFDANGSSLGIYGEKGEPVTDGSQFTPVAEIGDFILARGVAVAGDGSVWVTDGITYFRGGLGESYSRIQHFSTDGVVVDVINLDHQAPQGGDGFDLAIAEDGSLWVADANNGQIQHYNTDGTLISQFNDFNTDAQPFWGISGIALSTDGSIWVTEGFNNRLLHLNSDGSIIKIVGSNGAENGKFSWPHGLVVATDGSVWVADTGNNRLQHFNSDGVFIEAIGSFGTDAGQFNMPFDIAIGADGVLWVADKENKRVQKIIPQNNEQASLAVTYDEQQKRLILHDVIVGDVHYQAVLQNQNGRFVLESASKTTKLFESPATFDEAENLLSIPLAWAFNTNYQATFKHLGGFVFELISASPKE